MRLSTSTHCAPTLVDMATVTIPILPSADFDVTAGFWADFGFAETGRWPAEYLTLRHDALGIELHFWHDPDVDRWSNDVACYVRFDTPDQVRAAHEAWADAQIHHPAQRSEPQDEPWGAVEFHIIDMHGNLVRLGGFPPGRRDHS
jgi:hypothetical protein